MSRSRRKSRSPASPNTPDRWLSMDSISSTLMFARRDQVADDAGVDVAAARAHHQALQRSQAHRRVDRPAAGDRRGRGAVTQMQHNLIQTVRRPAQEGGGLLADVAVRRAVKSVPADLPPLGQSAVDRVGGGRSGRSWKKAVSNTATCGDVGQQLARHLDSLDRGRIVQRGQFRQLRRSRRPPRRPGASAGKTACRRAPPDARPPPGRRSSGRCPPRPAASNARRSAASWSATGEDSSPIRSIVPPARDAPESGFDQLVFQRRRAGVDHQHNLIGGLSGHVRLAPGSR